MTTYLVLLRRGARAPDSPRHLGTVANVTLEWVDELRAAGVLLATGTPDADAVLELTDEHPVRGCLLITAPTDEVARAVAGTCPVPAQLRPSVVRMTCEPRSPRLKS